MNATLPDASPLTDDLDDLTLHEPVTKENDMNEARASERADLAELRRLIAAASDLPWNVGNSPHATGQHIYTLRAACVADTCKPTFPDTECRSNAALIVAACNALPGLIAEVERQAETILAHESKLAKFTAGECACVSPAPPHWPGCPKIAQAKIAELSRASATAQEPADTKAVMANTEAGIMADFENRLNAILNASSAIQKDGVKPFCEARTAIRALVQRLAERASPSPQLAATASRTVSVDREDFEAAAVVIDNYSGHLINVPALESAKYHLHKVANELRKLARSAPSVAEPEKCGTCKDEGAVYAIHTGWSDCPDCTPASAEQKCVCGEQKPVCGQQYSRVESRELRCINHTPSGKCNHRRACHADEVKP